MIIRLCLRLLFTPRRGIRAILESPPRRGSLLVFLGVVGILRGVLEAAWLYGMARQPGFLARLLETPGRYLAEGALFVAANGMTAYLRWALYLVLFLGVARWYWYGKRVPFRALGDMVGLALGLYLVPVLINVLYLFFPLPVVQFPVTQAYQPIIGIGTWVASAWFGWVAFRIFSDFCGMSRAESLLGALFIPLVDKALFIGAAAVIFRWQWLVSLPVTERMGLATLGFLAVALASIPVFLRVGRRLAGTEAGR